VDIVVLFKNFNSSHFLFRKNPLKSVEILSPEANLSSSHTTKSTSFRRCGIAEADAARDFLLKTGLKSEFGSVEPEQGVAKSNWLYAVPSGTYQNRFFSILFLRFWAFLSDSLSEGLSEGSSKAH
jgi:hypothetical protein